MATPSGNGDESATQVSADILTEFLEVAIHSILFVREIYPAGVFQRKKKYNIPVQLCCHPSLVKYVQDAVQSLRPLLEKKELEKVVIVILSKNFSPVERFVFEVAPNNRTLSSDNLLLHLEQSLRAFLLRLNTCQAVLAKKPEGCTWTVQVHTTNSAALTLQKQPLIQDFTWVTADEQEINMENARLIPLKAEDTVVAKMQLYVEEKLDKYE